MAKLASNCLLLFLLSLLTTSSSGILVGFSYNARRSAAASSLSRIVSSLQSNKVPSSHIRVVANHGVLPTLPSSNVSVDLYLNENLVSELFKSKSFAISWMNSNVVAFVPRVNIKNIILSAENNLPRLLLALTSIHSVLRNFDLDNEVKVSVVFSSSFFENMDGAKENGLHGIIRLIKKTRSFLTLETTIDTNVKLELEDDLLYKLLIQKVELAMSILPCNDVPVVMKVKSFVVSSAKKVAEFADKVSEFLQNSQVLAQVAELYVDVSSALEDLASKQAEREHEQIFPPFRREMLNKYRTVSHDAIYPPVVYPSPINPVTTPPVTFSPENPAPTIVTVPGTTTPTNPVPTTPLPIPSNTPMTFPPPNPAVNPAVPVTNPVTTPAPITVPGAPVTNPVTTYPAPAGNIPVVTPVTNPVAPPATTNAPAIPGQSWCVARSGVPETALQSALDYACGMGGADCSAIQQGGNCYNPNSLQNHASYAFNSYYQKNPVATSCDFGGTATIVSTNPTTGTCVYSSSATSSLPTPSTSTANPATANPATTNPATTSSPGAGGASTGVPPSVLNSSNPASSNTNIFGLDTPPGVSPPASKSTTLQPLLCCIILVTTFVTGIITRSV